jgi:LacI family transcriptional regulator
MYFPEVHAGIVAYAQAARWALFDLSIYFPSSLYNYAEECDGILATVCLENLSQWLTRKTCPIVRVACTNQEISTPAVEPDSEGIGARGAEHLLTLGSPTFAFFRGGATRESNLMWQGFSKTIERAGHKAHLLDFSSSPDSQKAWLPRQNRWEWLRYELADLPRPLALMVEDDRFVNDSIEAAAMLGWRIPQDLAVLGADNRALVLGKYPIGVSSVDSNLYGLGSAAAALLDRMLDGETPPTTPVIVPCGPVVARESTATFVCDHPKVVAAVNFLRAHSHEPIQLADVSRAAGMSTRSIQSAFREHVGRTISEELSRLRLGRASTLLRETDLKLDSIAFESGLTSAKYLCSVFRAAFQQTPTEYREAARSAHRPR